MAGRARYSEADIARLARRMANATSKERTGGGTAAGAGSPGSPSEPRVRLAAGVPGLAALGAREAADLVATGDELFADIAAKEAAGAGN